MADERDAAQRPAAGDEGRRRLPTIGVALVLGGVESVHLLGPGGQAPEPEGGFAARRFLETLGHCPIDAISVGHYLGVPPQYAEAAIDRSISRALRERAEERIAASPGGDDGADELTPEREPILAQYVERGLLRGDLAEPFFLPDPRRDGDRRVERLIAIAGMGVAGKFGAPELTVLTRELCWSLGRLGKRHLATVLIGSGAGNLALADAVHSWMRGIEQGLGGAVGRHPQLERVTFVEKDPARMAEFDRALEAETGRMAAELGIEYTPLTPNELGAFRGLAERRREERERKGRRQAPDGDDEGRVATRVNVQLERTGYRFGAITSTASIPERIIPLQNWLVEAANDELTAEVDAALQLERGRFLGQLLIPEDLRPQFFTRDPLVLMLDRSTARIPWEMVAPSGSALSAIARPAEPDLGPDQFREEHFLGTARGLTRQLRTTFAPPPEPPPPPRRVLRVLVVADPAEDAPLAGAIREGEEVVELFEDFNRLYGAPDNRVEVVSLLGPKQATATSVLRAVMTRPYDVLHFAGHCLFDPDDPSASGWLFSLKDRRILTADMLNRIDRIPKFVLSNACESGVTPDRPEGYSIDLAPSFAEAFFQRGVANFVCTAWPVADDAARAFARGLYEGLLGLRPGPDRTAPFERMHRAMLGARLAVARSPDGTINRQGARTWGAYQHYGDPNFRFFHSDQVRGRRSSLA